LGFGTAYRVAECLDGCCSLLVVHTSALPVITRNHKHFVDACAAKVL
jgi:hypothetical protein